MHNINKHLKKKKKKETGGMHLCGVIYGCKSRTISKLLKQKIEVFKIETITKVKK